MRVPTVCLIVNPASGRGRGAVRQEAVERELQARGVPYSAAVTAAPGHATGLTRDAVHGGARLLFAIGGDGTVRDVAAGIIEAQSHGAVDHAHGPVLAILGGGTGNDLARSLRIPAAVGPALDLALSGPTLPLDAWRWNDTVFVNVAGVGLDAAVAEAVNHRFRKLRGTLAYIAAFLHTVPRFRPLELRLSCPQGDWRGRAWLAAFANGRFYGGGMEIAPTADPTDGALEVVVVEDVPRLELLRQFPKLFRGLHVGHPKVRTMRVSGVTLEASEQRAMIDGELIGTVPAELRRIESCLRVRSPGGTGRARKSA